MKSPCGNACINVTKVVTLMSTYEVMVQVPQNLYSCLKYLALATEVNFRNLFPYPHTGSKTSHIY